MAWISASADGVFAAVFVVMGCDLPESITVLDGVEGGFWYLSALLEWCLFIQTRKKANRREKSIPCCSPANVL